ncbi:MAG: F0F1 ATP synthase subunit B [Alphaproteobacteria bacterium]|nr:F0F1 ATP synthase subunit B [Alphaproteobacteria bacterium]
MEHEAFYDNPVFWVSVAFVAFIVLAYKKVSTLLVKALDDRSEKIRVELETARALRAEAEAVLAEYKQKQAEYLKEAEAMLARARSDADAMSAHAEKELKAALDERTKNALEKIAQEEMSAVAEVRAHVVDMALSAARDTISKQMTAPAQEKLLAAALSDIERKVH